MRHASEWHLDGVNPTSADRPKRGHRYFGADSQKNFQLFMQRMREQYPEGFVPDAAWFRRLVSLAIIHRVASKLAKRIKFPAYQANIVAYTVAWLGWMTGGRIDFERVWIQQSVSGELESLLETWLKRADEVLRASAGERMPTEWAKKPECWAEFKNHVPSLPSTLPSELSAQVVSAIASGEIQKITIPLTADDLALINKAREFDATKWLQIANWARRSKSTYKLAGIAETLAQYAAGGWERSPSAKQAKWGLELAKRMLESSSG